MSLFNFNSYNIINSSFNIFTPQHVIQYNNYK